MSKWICRALVLSLTWAIMWWTIEPVKGGEIETMPWTGGNRYLGKAEQQQNADMIGAYFTGKGWTLQAICGMLGNMEAESTINPGIWQSLDDNHPEPWGYGLVQWTPSTKYSNWAGAGWQNNGSKQCDRIQYELDNGLQWGATNKYPMSFHQFTVSELSAGELAQVFLYNYEKPANLNQPGRSTNAEEWWEYFGGIPPEPTGNLPVWLYFKFRKG